MDNINNFYSSCSLCPRNCRTDRISGGRGYCRQLSDITAASALLHGGEEPPVSGENGSGTVFFTGCTLQCTFCQNSQISRGKAGSRVSIDEFSEICLKLQAKGAENINLVTGSQFIPSIAAGLEKAKKGGLDIPVLWNSSGYETAESVKMLLPHIDIFLPDYKTADPAVAADFFNAPDYPDVVFKAVSAMCDNIETDFSIFETGAMIKRGVIIRHLVMPGYLESTENFLKIFAENFSDKAILSIMFQYSPAAAGCKGHNPDRGVSVSESSRVYELLEKYRIENGFIQELDNNTDWVPDFNKLSPFPGGSEGRTVWHWKSGFVC